MELMGMTMVRKARRAQSAVEYLFMLAAAMILVAIAIKVVFDATRELQQSVEDYTKTVRERIMENL